MYLHLHTHTHTEAERQRYSSATARAEASLRSRCLYCKRFKRNATATRFSAHDNENQKSSSCSNIVAPAVKAVEHVTSLIIMNIQRSLDSRSVKFRFLC